MYGKRTDPQGENAARTEGISGLVERVTFHSDESGFCVLRVKARGHRDLVTVVGTLPEVRAGEWLEAQGRWIVNKEYGQQFQAEILRTMPPTTVEGIEKYLASGMIKGIGPVLAGQVVKLVVLVGTLKALAIAVKNMDACRRVTLLKQRLKAFLAPGSLSL